MLDAPPPLSALDEAAIDRLFVAARSHKGRRDAAYAAETAFRNSSLQAAHPILAARALGLDACPMSGFDRERLDAAFFAGTTISASLLVALGVGDPAALPKRPPCLSFADACRFA